MPLLSSGPRSRLFEHFFGGERQDRDDSARKNMLLLLQLRWIAVAGQIGTIAVVWLGLGIDLPLAVMSLVVLGLAVLNALSFGWIRRGGHVSESMLFAALFVDVLALSTQIYLSGGVTNPFTSLFLLQVTLAAVLLQPWMTGVLGAFAALALVVLTYAYRPLAFPVGSERQLFDLYLVGVLLGLAINAGLIAVFVTRISRNLRERDARLAAMRQQAVEEDHIVRIGLLASGAAHELGTPLSSLSVILGDWRHMPELMASPAIASEIEEMQEAVARCKAIVTRILLAAGAPRGEASRLTTVRSFVKELVDEWRRMRACDTLRLRDAFGEDRPIVSDTALKQIVFNVLDNAHDVSPEAIEIIIDRVGDALELRVLDRGPGFPPDVLERMGEPYISSKGRLGGGLGLFLVVNVVRKLGGRVSAGNRAEGGAAVTIALPLEALAV